MYQFSSVETKGRACSSVLRYWSTVRRPYGAKGRKADACLSSFPSKNWYPIHCPLLVHALVNYVQTFTCRKLVCFSHTCAL